MYNYHVKVLPEVFETYFLPIYKLIITILEANPNKIIFLILSILTVAGTRNNLMAFKCGIRFLQKLSLTHFIVFKKEYKKYCSEIRLN